MASSTRNRRPSWLNVEPGQGRTRLYRKESGSAIVVTTRCSRPARPFADTPLGNMLDRVRRHRQATGAKIVGDRDFSGVKNPFARFTEDQTRAIRTADGTFKELARRFGVRVKTIFNIRHGISYAEVTQ
jgi:hypothetical protein